MHTSVAVKLRRGEQKLGKLNGYEDVVAKGGIAL